MGGRGINPETPRDEPPPMNALSAFGLFAATAMLVCYALDARSHWWTLGFAGACLMGSIYGFLQGASPFGLVEGVWAIVAPRRWCGRGRVPVHQGEPRQQFYR